MKSGIYFNYTIFIFICQILLCFGFNPSALAADSEYFYFDSFEADYYVSKDSNNVSKMKVIETFVTVFPEYTQHKGICRMIPNTNQKGANRTLETLNRSNIKVLRNGEPEPIYSIDESNGYFEVCTGDNSYVFGVQEYTFEYTFTKVITNFSEGDKEWQELYWDTNGSGWSQHFNQLIARVHFEDSSVMSGNAWCYVGKNRESGQDRCEITKTTDGYIFNTKNLSRDEILSYDIDLKPGSFEVPGPDKNYAYLIIPAAIAILCGYDIWKMYKKSQNLRNKKAYYDKYFIKPEYAPHPKYCLQELSEIYLGKLKSVRIATLLEMIVSRKIEIIKNEKKSTPDEYDWVIHILNYDACSKYEKDLLSILAGGETIYNGMRITIKPYTPTSRLGNLDRHLRYFGSRKATDDGLLLEKEDCIKRPIEAYAIVVYAFMIGGLIILFAFLSSDTDITSIAFPIALFIVLSIVFSVIIYPMIINKKYARFKRITIKGIDASRYLDGLKLYITMAEKDRLNFLQSVEGADTTPEGVVRLYEKLLPYAALFGIEKSWIKELSRYCETSQVKSYLINSNSYSFDSDVVMRTVDLATSYSISSTDYHSSSKSSRDDNSSSHDSSSSSRDSYSRDSYDSSGSSGSHGRGYAGGGGGGGGGHGR